MISEKVKLSIVLYLIISLFTVSGYGYYYDSIDKVKFEGYAGEGSFVENPAYWGSCFGYVLGLIPAEVISEPQRISNYNQASDNTGVAVLKVTTKPSGLLFGGFPYLLKKAFWDFPIWVFGGDISKPTAYASKPVPVKEIEVPPELQDTQKLKLKEETTAAPLPDSQSAMETAPAPKIELTPLPQGIGSDSIRVPEQGDVSLPSASNVSEAQPVQVPQAPQMPQTQEKTWQGQELPDWLSKDLSQ